MAGPKSERRLFFLLIAYLCVCLNLLRHFSAGSAESDILKAFRARADLGNHAVKTWQGDVSLKEINERVFRKLGYEVAEITHPVPTLRFVKKPTCFLVDGHHVSVSNFSLEAEGSCSHLVRENTENRGRLLNRRLQSFNDCAFSMFNYSSVSSEKSSRDENALNCAKLTTFLRRSPRPESDLQLDDWRNQTSAFVTNTGAPRWIECLNSGFPLSFPNATWEIFLKPLLLDFTVLSTFSNPLDDLREVENIRCSLKIGGTLILGLHIGLDHLVVDSHRVYGPIRLAMVATGFEVIAVFNTETNESVEIDERMFQRDTASFYILVLRKR